MEENVDLQSVPDDKEVVITGAELRSFVNTELATVRTELTAELTKSFDEKFADNVRAINPLNGNAPIRVEVGAERTPYDQYTTDKRAIMQARFMRAFAASEGDMSRTVQTLRAWQKEEPTPEGERQIRALTEGDYSAGGAFVQTQYASEYIPLLRERSVIMRAGMRQIQMPGGNLSMGRITSGVTSYYRGEGDDAIVSGIGTGSLNLSSKELVTQAVISKRLLKHASISFDVIVRDDMIASHASTKDAKFLRGVGSEDSPKGLRYLANPAHVVDLASLGTTPTLAQVRAALTAPELAFEESNVPIYNLTAFIAPRTRNFLKNVVDANGQPVYKAEMAQGLLEGVPFFSTNQLPKNLGTGNESEIIWVDMFHVFFANDGSMEMTADDKVSYKDENGVMQSAHSRGEMVIQSVESHDFGVRYDKAIYVQHGVKWGA